MSQKRSIFEEVSGDAPRRDTPKGMIDRGGQGREFARVWLIVLFALVVVMIAVGGLTRLTDSGLSITEWRPVTGAIPPTSAEAWDAEFEKYKSIPEFQLQNSAMTLEEFKTIYWWEWGHRQLGRLIGLVWAVGMAAMLIRKRMPTGWARRFLLLGVLGGLQGAVGWWMVSSGLTGRMVDVASYRLAIHLGLAFVILGLIARYVMALSRPEGALMRARRAGEARLAGAGTGLMHLAFLQILLGALVAGIDAGRTYTDWPLMAGGLLPPGMWELSPLWSNLFENPGTVQFLHRIAGYAIVITAIVVWRRSRASGNSAVRQAFDWIAVMAFGQMVLGIGTVIYVAPLGLALIHQLGAVVLWTLIIRAVFLAKHPPEQSVRTR